MLNLHAPILKVRVVFHTLDRRNEVSDPHFFAFLTQVTHYLTAVKFLKKHVSTRKFLCKHPSYKNNNKKYNFAQ